MTQSEGSTPLSSARVLVTALTVTTVVLGLALVAVVVGRSGATGDGLSRPRIDALANSRDECVDCHRQASPGIVQQYGHSTMAAADVECRDCHEVWEG